MRLLLAVSAAGLLAFVAAWPSQGAVTESPPLYLARERGGGGSDPASTTFTAVGDASRLAGHLVGDGEDLGALEVVDSAGRVVVLQANGKVDTTGAAVDPVVLKNWLHTGFKVRARALDQDVPGGVGDQRCWNAKQAALSRLRLPTHSGTRELTLAETFAEADARIAAMHEPVNQIPLYCIPNPSHRAGYLHNLWHRITGTS